MIDGADERADAAARDADALQIIGGFLIGEAGELALDLRADHHGLRAKVRAREILHGGDVAGGGGDLHVLAWLHAFIVAPSLDERGDAGQIGFGHIAGKDGRLAGKEKKLAEQFLLVVAQGKRGGGFSGIEVRDELLGEGHFSLRQLVAAARSLGLAIGALLHRGEIGKDELGVDHFDIAHRIDGPRDVMNVFVFKTADYLHDRVDFTNVTEELVAQALARARPFDESSDVDELDRCGDDLLRVTQLREGCEPRIRHRDDAHVGIDRAEGVVRRLRLLRAGDGIEESRFADVGEADDACRKHDEEVKSKRGGGTPAQPFPRRNAIPRHAESAADPRSLKRLPHGHLASA